MATVASITRSIIPRLLFFTVFCLILGGVIAYARGYRVNFTERTVTSTGIISVNSTPRPATVYLNGELQGATDVNLTLPFGDYTIEVKKDGYTDWKKKVNLKGELVMSLDAKLFSKNPSLTPLTTLGVIKAVKVGSTDRAILVSQTGDVEKDGLYLFEASARPIPLFPPVKPLLFKSLLPATIDLKTTRLVFNPNYRQALIEFDLNETETVTYLIPLDTETKELFDVTASRENIIAAWDLEKQKEVARIIETFPKKIRPMATNSFQIISLSPDEKKVMYIATAEATLPLVIDPPLIAANQSLEERNIKANNIYIYDKKEDKNFRVDFDLTDIQPSLTNPTTITPSPAVDTPVDTDLSLTELATYVHNHVQWYPTSDYLALKEDNQIILMQYDGDNKQSVYAGPFENDFFTVSPDWNLLVLINLNPQANEYGDLYSIGLR
ncbi:MAG: PEGA domain-containing protein [Weeksellaceae bacterium]